MISTKDGEPPGPEKGADMPILLAVMLIMLIRKRIQNLKLHIRHLLMGSFSLFGRLQTSSTE